MEIPLLRELVTIFGLAAVVLMGCSRLKIPIIVGLLVTGILCGPHGLLQVGAVHEVEILAEMGVVLLLFTIGLEFSLQKLMSTKREVLLGGGAQVLFTGLLVALGCLGLQLSLPQAIFFGCAVSLSSTAITLKILQEKAQVSSRYGRFVVAVLIFQDMAAVPMMLLTPVMAGSAEGGTLDLLRHLGLGLAIITVVFVGAQWVIPRVLYFVASTRNSQFFLLFILLLCFSTAYLTSSVGLSLPLGAFLAGLIISESEYSDHAVSHILPFQAIFSSFFFISVGMLLDMSFVLHHVAEVAICALAILILKFLVAGGAARMLGYPMRACILAGLAVCQVGEFAFILLRGALGLGFVSDYAYQLMLAVSVASMIGTPFLMQLGPQIANLLLKRPLPKWLRDQHEEVDTHMLPELSDHVVIAGFGICGRNLAWAAKLAGVPYAIIELNPETVRNERQKGETIVFGDASQTAVLERVHVEASRMVVVAIDDPVATRATVEMVRRVAPHVYILVRTRYLKEIETITELGADDVIPEEFETSVEIFSRVLSKYLIPEEDIRKFCAEARARKYRTFRSISPQKVSLTDLTVHLPEIKVEVFRLPQGCGLEGKSLGESGLRSDYGITVLMIRRNQEKISNPAPHVRLQAGDLLVIFGEPNGVSQLMTDLKPAAADI